MGRRFAPLFSYWGLSSIGVYLVIRTVLYIIQDIAQEIFCSNSSQTYLNCDAIASVLLSQIVFSRSNAGNPTTESTCWHGSIDQ